MPTYTFPPAPVLVETTGEFAIGATGILRATDAGDPVDVFDLNGSPLPSILVGPKGAHQAFRADISAGVLDFGSVLLPVLSLEAQRAGLTAEVLAGQALSSSTLAAQSASAAQTAAASSASSAATSAGLVGAPADSIVAALFNSNSASAGAIAAKFPPRDQLTVNVARYGTNAAAFASAAAAAGPGGTIFAPRAAGPYTIATPVVLDRISLVSDGADITATALGAGVRALTFHSPPGSGGRAVAQGFNLTGPGTRLVGVKNANCDGVAITGDLKLTTRDVDIRFFDKGIDLANDVGHLYFEHVGVDNCYYGVYCSLDTYDYFFDNCLINGNLFANFATPADQGFSGIVIQNSHIGYAPYGIYQEAAPAAQGGNKQFLAEALLRHARFEQIGNAAIWSDATVDSTNFSLAGSLTIEHPGFSWGDINTYGIVAKGRSYSVLLPQTERIIRIINGAYPFLTGGTGVIRIKKAAHASFVIEGSGATAAAVTALAAPIGLRVFAYEKPLAGGLLNVGGDDASPTLDLAGSSGGYFRPTSSDQRRIGGDASYLFADFNNDFRFRNSGAGYALIGRVATDRMVMPRYQVAESGPTWTAGTGVPSASEPNGSLYTRTDGAAGTTLYVRAAGAWSAVS